MQTGNQTITTSKHCSEILLPQDRIILLCYYSITAALGIIGNILVLLGILVPKQNRKELHNYYLITLSVANLILSLVASLTYISSLVLTKLRPHSESLDNICKCVLFIYYIAGLVGLLTIATISVDRYVALKHPFLYSTYFNKRKVISINIYAWIQAFISCLPPVTKNQWAKYDGKPGLPCGFQWRAISLVYGLVIVAINFVIPAIIVFFTNIHVFLIARKQSKRTPVLGELVAQDDENCLATSSTVSVSECRNGLLGADIKAKCFHGQTKANLEIVKGSENNNEPSSMTTNVHQRRTTNQRNKSVDSDMAKTRAQCFQITLTGLENSTDLENEAVESKKILPNVTGAFVTCAVHSQKLPEHAYENGNRTASKEATSVSELKIATSTIALVIAFSFSWLPFLISRSVIAFSGIITSWRTLIYLTIFSNLNATLTPYIVLCTRKKIRKFILNKIFDWKGSN